MTTHRYSPGQAVSITLNHCPGCSRPLATDLATIYQCIDDDEIEPVDPGRTFWHPNIPELPLDGPYYALALRYSAEDPGDPGGVCCNPVVAESEIRHAVEAPPTAEALVQ